MRGLDRHDILRAFEKRVGNTPEQEFQTARHEVERIALLRLYQITGQPQHVLGQALMDRLESSPDSRPSLDALTRLFLTKEHRAARIDDGLDGRGWHGEPDRCRR